MSENDSQQGYDRCGAKGRGGGTCGLPAGWGTEHKGYGSCRKHGGNTRNHVKAAQGEQARQAVATYGLPREIDPHAALLEELHRTAGHVRWLQEVVNALDTDEGRGKLVEITKLGEQPSVWQRLYDQERKHFIAVSRSCVAAGIAERQVQIAEDQAQRMADMQRAILEELGIEITPEVSKVVGRHLRLVEPAA